MRLLSKHEISICKRILALGNQNAVIYFGNIIGPELKDFGIILLLSKQEVHFIIPSDVPRQELLKPENIESAKKLNEKYSEILPLIVETVNILTMLVDSGYIALVKKSMALNDKVGYGVINENFPTTRLNDKNLEKLIIEYDRKDIYLTEEFRSFCRHNFISREEWKFRKQYYISVAALIVAIIIGIWSIFSSHC